MIAATTTPAITALIVNSRVPGGLGITPGKLLEEWLDEDVSDTAEA